MRNIRVTLFLLGVMLVGLGVFLSGASAANEPTAPSTLTVSGTTTFDEGNYQVQSLEAIAGNITSLQIFAVGQTKSWQGYYGNITATVTLDDADNYTFYNWSSAEPRGQIYATLNTSIAWDTIECFNFTDPTTNETVIENYYTIQTDDVDGVPETFNATDHVSFEVASNTITGCPTTYIYQSDDSQYVNFVNVLLFDSNIPESGWVYTAIIENKTQGSSNDLLCYNGAACDFQILVNEDGHGTDIATTTYYFWVELL